VTLTNAVYDAYKVHESLSETALRAYLEAPRSEPARQRVVVDGPRLPGVPPNMPVGYAGIRYEEDEEADERIYYLNLTVHKVVEGLGLERVLASRLMDIVRDHESDPGMKRMAKVRIKAGTLEQMANKRTLFREIGLREVRQFWTMARSLHAPIDEPAHIDGVVIRPFVYPRESEGVRAAFNNSFSDHWDHHHVGQADWEHWISQELMRPDLSILAEVENNPGNIAGFCIISIVDDDNKRRGVEEGWIDILGTTRDWRRVGLGRSLLLHGLYSLKNAGMDTALLGVDSTSLTGANKLYESVGFRIRDREFAYEAPIQDVKV
jgi:mycothiol synthase